MAIYENAKPLSYILNKGLTPNPYKSAYKMGRYYICCYTDNYNFYST